MFRRRRLGVRSKEQYKVVVFDFDGTIADTFPVIVDIFHMLSRRKVPLNEAEEKLLRGVALRQVKGRAMLRHAREINVSYWRIPFLFIISRELLKGRMHQVKPMPGMHHAIKILHEKGFKLYIMSANSENNIRKFLKHEHLNSYFADVYGDVRVGSKAGRLQDMITADLAHPKDTICVGDEGRDIAAAKQAGLKNIAVCWGYNSEKQLKDEHPTHVVKNVSQLLKTLGIKNGKKAD